MDKRSFIRGFGVGVLFTALILGISFVVRTSDAYVKSQALKLGMVYKEDQGEDLVFTSPGPEETAKQEGGKDTGKQDGDKKGKDNKAKATPKPKKTPASKETKKPEDASRATEKPVPPAATARPQATKKPVVSPKPGNTRPKKTAPPREKQKLTIVAGEWSSDVSEKLERMGIVKNAKQFDKYLNDNGYSERISAGTYSVSASDSYEQLARKITNR